MLDILIPMMTTMVLNTSEAEWTASLIIAPEWATMPARSLNTDKTIFAAMLTYETFIAIFSKSFFIKFTASLKRKRTLSMASAIRIYQYG